MGFTLVTVQTNILISLANSPNCSSKDPLRNIRLSSKNCFSETRHLAQEQQVSCFNSGLKDNIRTEVQAGRHATLSSAIGLAKLYEARNKARDLVSSKVSSTNYEAQSSPTTMLIRRLTMEESDQRRKKGLCFKCNEKFGPEHHCKKLFMIQACLNDNDADEEMEIIGGSLEIPWPP
ncbi:hypothetical protein Pint_07508 [Pistacia integerrima]|uniref:Uncharacterized protein n=1 Tax=Pistacia integerrima TaxID=434235 RepID=A0ACC0XX77_9ROSI|nr:hypothetical protein Pint_07508 [Pistacia integerrima]